MNEAAWFLDARSDRPESGSAGSPVLEHPNVGDGPRLPVLHSCGNFSRRVDAAAWQRRVAANLLEAGPSKQLDRARTPSSATSWLRKRAPTLGRTICAITERSLVSMNASSLWAGRHHYERVASGGVGCVIGRRPR